MKKERDEKVEITPVDISNFLYVVTHIMIHDEKWINCDNKEKEGLLQAAIDNFTSNSYGETNGSQTFVDAIYFLLQDLGYEKEAIKGRWKDALRHRSSIDSSVLAVPNTPNTSLTIITA